MLPSTIEFLKHILLEVDFLVRKTECLTYDDFVNDEVLTRAFARSLEIIGEARQLRNYPMI